MSKYKKLDTDAPKRYQWIIDEHPPAPLMIGACRSILVEVSGLEAGQAVDFCGGLLETSENRIFSAKTDGLKEILPVRFLRPESTAIGAVVTLMVVN